MFAVNLVYHLPTLSGANGFTKGALGSWEIGTITNATSGRSYTVRDYLVVGGTGNTNNARPNRVAGQACYANSSDPAQILNPAAFTDVDREIGTLGNSYRGDCRGPKLVNTDFALYKNFPSIFKGSKLFREGMNIQFRFEFFNLFNHTNFKEINSDYSLQAVTYDNGSGDLVHNGIPATKIVAAPVVNHLRHGPYRLRPAGNPILDQIHFLIGATSVWLPPGGHTRFYDRLLNGSAKRIPAKREKSRSPVSSSVTPCSRQSATMWAS